MKAKPKFVVPLPSFPITAAVAQAAYKDLQRLRTEVAGALSKEVASYVTRVRADGAEEGNFFHAMAVKKAIIAAMQSGDLFAAVHVDSEGQVLSESTVRSYAEGAARAIYWGVKFTSKLHNPTDRVIPAPEGIVRRGRKAGTKVSGGKVKAAPAAPAAAPAPTGAKVDGANLQLVMKAPTGIEPAAVAAALQKIAGHADRVAMLVDWVKAHPDW